MPLAAESREYTNFSTNKGHFHYKRMPMGLKVSPNNFQRLMNSVLMNSVRYNRIKMFSIFRRYYNINYILKVIYDNI